MHDDGVDDFDWDAWGEPDSDDSSGVGGIDTASQTGQNGHHQIGQQHADMPAAEHEPVPGGWVTAGGVVHWEDAEGVDAAQNETDSPLAADDLELPEGAPQSPRVRAVHAWIVRQRARELDALGGLLISQRAQQAAEEEQPRARRRAARARASQDSPVELAIAEHQAAADEYSAQLERLDDIVAHNGAGLVLVEFHLWLADYLVNLAGAPDADDSAGPATTREGAIWRGRALAALAVRGRIERVSAPLVDDD